MPQLKISLQLWSLVSRAAPSALWCEDGTRRPSSRKTLHAIETLEGANQRLKAPSAQPLPWCDLSQRGALFCGLKSNEVATISEDMSYSSPWIFRSVRISDPSMSSYHSNQNKLLSSQTPCLER
jgi:hypothetical protein